MNDVLAVIVTYNRKKILKECLDALEKTKCDILVIDNHSTDGTKNVIPKTVKYFDTKINLGGAGGYNIGVREACKYDYKYFWLMDDDCIVNEDALEKLLDADKKLNGKWGFLSSKVLWVDNTICKTNVQRKKVAKKITDFDTEILNVDYASFVSLLIKKEDVMKIGLPIRDFYIWTDDLEFTRRLTINCDKGYLVNSSIVVHKCKDNIGVDITKDSEERLDRYRFIYRNDVYTFKREGISGWSFIFFRYIYHMLKILFTSKDKKKKIDIMTNGYLEGLKFNPKIEYI